MNKLIELLRGCEHDGTFIPVNEVNRLMQEYGKYCAEEAFSAGFRESKEYYPLTFSEFWAEFEKEETK